MPIIDQNHPSNHRGDGAHPGYAELCCQSNFTFLTGASHPEELIFRAIELRLAAIAITDRNSLAGVVRAHVALKEYHRQREVSSSEPAPDRSAAAQNSADHPQDFGDRTSLPHLPRLIIGSYLTLTDSPVNWVALPTNRAAYGRLSRLLSVGKQRANKGACHLTSQDLLQGSDGIILIALPHNVWRIQEELEPYRALCEKFHGHIFLGAIPLYDGHDPQRFDVLSGYAHQKHMPMVAMGGVLMHHAARRPLADILTCIRENCTIDHIGTHALPHAEYRLKSAAEMTHLFRHHLPAIHNTLTIARTCQFSLDELCYEYPDETISGETAQQHLIRLTEEGIRQRYPNGINRQTRAKITKELTLIEKMNFAAYFLTAHSIVQFARKRGILCQGRGSAANSIICYALGITEVSPDMIAMVFERFISEARSEPPDIDIDFEHERREEVIQYIYQRYGRHRAGLTATVIHFRRRAAIREVGKAMGLSQDLIAAIANQKWGRSSPPSDIAQLHKLGLDPTTPRLALTLKIIRELIGFPRHLSQHVGGFVITKGRLDELCPIENAAMDGRTVIEWNKDDIDALGILKIDILSLGMLTCIRKCFDLIATHTRRHMSLGTIPKEDPHTYDMLCRADAIGVFQVESRAQMSFLPRMRPRCFYDLVIEVAIIRPGPIQGGMIHPYLRRRQKREPVDLASGPLSAVLARTLGVPLFQEQAMQIAIVGAGFTAEEADRLRRSLATFRRMGTISLFRDRFIKGMLERGYTSEFAQRCFAQIEGFAEYGFPESHAASFALLVYASAWLKCHHPAAFACALLNAQPMGFYAPAQIIRDARQHGVRILSISINHSHWDCTLESQDDGAHALRLGFRQIKGLARNDADWLVAARGNGYPDIDSLYHRAGISSKSLERLIDADACTCLGLTRRQALWQARAIAPHTALPLFAGQEDTSVSEALTHVPRMTLGEEIIADYQAIRLSLRGHPITLLRPQLTDSCPHIALADHSRNHPHASPTSPGQAGGTRAAKPHICVAGLVITRQRPATASGVIFITLEDDTALANIIIWPRIYQQFRTAILTGRLLQIRGWLQYEDSVCHVIAEHIEDMSHLLDHLACDGRQAPQDQRLTQYSGSARHPRQQAKRLFPSRDFQ